MTLKRWSGLGAGVFIALVVPVSYRILAELIENGTLHVERTKELTDTLTTVALFELLLGPLGIIVAGISAGVRRPVAWLALSVIAVPTLIVVWLVCVLVLSSALGSPL